MDLGPGTTTYLDHAATTALRPQARAAWLRVAGEAAANPTGVHRPAQRMRAHLEDARERVATACGVEPSRVVFTSGGTESDNTAVAAGLHRGRVLYSAVEHPAVAEAASMVGGEEIPVDAEGVVDLSALAELLAGDPVGLVSVMAANNETGVVQPLAEIGALVRELAPGAWFHTDAVQYFGKEPLPMSAAHLSAVSVSAHKLGGPVGTGALVLGPDCDPAPLLVGGGQERGMRAGTPDAAGAAAFAAAVEASYATDWERVRRLRDRLEAGLRDEVDGLVVHGAGAARLVTHCHVGIDAVPADMAVIACDRAGLALSSGSSCASGAHKRSGVLAAMGVSDEGAIRFSLGWTTTEADVDRALEVVSDVVARLRS